MADDPPTAPAELDATTLAGARARGKRPYFFEDADIERVLSITMAVAGELAVLRQRLDTIEELLETRGRVSRADIETFEPDPAHAERRGRWHQEYIARILRIVQQEAEATEQHDEPTSEEAGTRMGDDHGP